MDKKTMTIVVVAVVVIVIGIAAAFLLMNNTEKTAEQMANNFVKNNDGEFGTYVIDEAITGNDYILLTATQPLLNSLGENVTNSKGESQRVSSFKIYAYDSKEVAHDEFLEFITNSKNGSKGETLLSQQSKLGMASEALMIYDERDAAGDFCKRIGADGAFLFFASYIASKDTSAQYTQCCGAVQYGKNVIVFNETINFDLYINKAIYDEAVDGVASITSDYYEAELVKFFKAF